MLLYIIVFIVGVFFGAFVMALCNAGKDKD